MNAAHVDLAPVADEVPPCPVCCTVTNGLEVGTKGRFGLPVRNVLCERCGLCFQSPRPTEAAMAAYYSGAYRIHYGDVRYPFQGKLVGPGDADFGAALDAWHGNQAAHAAELGHVFEGAHVLEIGCRHGHTLGIMRERYGVVPHGVEPGPAEAEQARNAGVDCFTGTIERYEPGELRFDQIQLFHVLEHLHDPLGALLRFRDWLTPNGRLVIEVPNIYQPYGLLEENFFQNAHLTNFSPHTLAALLVRAGLAPLEVRDDEVLFAVAARDESATELPRAYSAENTPVEPMAAGRLARLLNLYAELEKARFVILNGGVTMDLVQQTLAVLAMDGFDTHRLRVVNDLVQFFFDCDAKSAALAVVAAASNGTRDQNMRRQLQRLNSELQLGLSRA